MKKNKNKSEISNIFCFVFRKLQTKKNPENSFKLIAIGWLTSIKKICLHVIGSYPARI